MISSHLCWGSRRTRWSPCGVSWIFRLQIWRASCLLFQQWTWLRKYDEQKFASRNSTCTLETVLQLCWILSRFEIHLTSIFKKNLRKKQKIQQETIAENYCCVGCSSVDCKIWPCIWHFHEYCEAFLLLAKEQWPTWQRRPSIFKEIKAVQKKSVLLAQ